VRQTIGELLAREVQDPGIGFITVTRVTMSPDLQVARIYYTHMGDEAARKTTRQALERALPFLRRQIGRRIRLRRVPELHVHFDETIENQARIERVLLDLQAEREARGLDDAAAEGPAADPSEDENDDESPD
jgi:ribosome-binding factor A